ncbi:hypothetical protein Q1695_014294 [Nippostrongylus brasiliensis]|nr:hypothetical protein Q1695_014294 [Nippostrongylus brasiliensis]
MIELMLMVHNGEDSPSPLGARRNSDVNFCQYRVLRSWLTARFVQYETFFILCHSIIPLNDHTEKTPSDHRTKQALLSEA